MMTPKSLALAAAITISFTGSAFAQPRSSRPPASRETRLPEQREREHGVEEGRTSVSEEALRQIQRGARQRGAGSEVRESIEAEERITIPMERSMSDSAVGRESFRELEARSTRPSISTARPGATSQRPSHRRSSAPPAEIIIRQADTPEQQLADSITFASPRQLKALTEAIFSLPSWESQHEFYREISEANLVNFSSANKEIEIRRILTQPRFIEALVNTNREELLTLLSEPTIVRFEAFTQALELVIENQVQAAEAQNPIEQLHQIIRNADISQIEQISMSLFFAGNKWKQHQNLLRDFTIANRPSPNRLAKLRALYESNQNYIQSVQLLPLSEVEATLQNLQSHRELVKPESTERHSDSPLENAILSILPHREEVYTRESIQTSIHSIETTNAIDAALSNSLASSGASATSTLSQSLRGLSKSQGENALLRQIVRGLAEQIRTHVISRDTAIDILDTYILSPEHRLANSLTESVLPVLGSTEMIANENILTIVLCNTSGTMYRMKKKIQEGIASAILMASAANRNHQVVLLGFDETVHSVVSVIDPSQVLDTISKLPALLQSRSNASDLNMALVQAYGIAGSSPRVNRRLNIVLVSDGTTAPLDSRMIQTASLNVIDETEINTSLLLLGNEGNAAMEALFHQGAEIGGHLGAVYQFDNELMQSYIDYSTRRNQ